MALMKHEISQVIKRHHHCFGATLLFFTFIANENEINETFPAIFFNTMLKLSLDFFQSTLYNQDSFNYASQLLPAFLKTSTFFYMVYHTGANIIFFCQKILRLCPSVEYLVGHNSETQLLNVSYFLELIILETSAVLQYVSSIIILRLAEIFKIASIFFLCR